MGLAGIPWWTTDIGGFQGAYTEDEEFHELLVRWFQFAVFCPVMRMHGSRMPHQEIKAQDGSSRRWTGAANELWSFGEDVYKILKKYVGIRNMLRSYIRGLMEDAHTAGSPVMRTMFYEFPDDQQCWELTTQYMFGSDILVAPVVSAGCKEREVYLPSGEYWVDAWTGRELEGGQSICVETPLEQIPLFVKKGSRCGLKVDEVLA